MSTTRELLADAAARLTDAGVPTPRVDAVLLLAHVTGRPRTLALLGDEPTRAQQAHFEALVARRAAREPLQHLTGSAPFRHLELAVGPGVFVPRPETELLLDPVLSHLATRAGRVILVDLCTGSGALALAMATEVPDSDVFAVEASTQALAWARGNIEAHAEAIEAAGSTIALVATDATRVADPRGALRRLVQHVDVLVSNPPYVPDQCVPRDPEVRDHDPAQALYGGPDGLDMIRALIGQAAQLLRPGGLLVVEHADVQGEAAGASGVPGLLRAAVGTGAATWCDVRDHLDLAGLPRFTSAVRARAMPDEARP